MRILNRFVLTIGIIIFSFDLMAQDSFKIPTTEVKFSMDNDFFLIPSLDRYYSSGFRLNWRKALSNRKVFQFLTGKNRELSKAIWGVELGHNFYTPRKLRETNVFLFDRPYAGWLYAAVGMDLFFSNASNLRMDLDLGVVGPAAGGETFQKWWHRSFGFFYPEGWKYQINNTPAANLRITYLKQLWSITAVDLISESSIQAGTTRNNLRQGLTLRFFRFGPMDNSIYTGSKIGGFSESDQTNVSPIEVSFFIGGTIEYVFYNSLIQGNFIGEPSFHTEAIIPWVFHHKLGMSIGGRNMDFTAALHKYTGETPLSLNHGYVNLDWSVRF